MRILLVSDWMTFAGGSEAYIVDLKQWLQDAGDEVHLLTCGTDGPAKADARAFGTDNTIAQAALQLFNPFAVARLRSVVREFRPDAALVSHFAFHLSPAILPALQRVPTIISVMDYKYVCPLGSKLLPDGTICRVPAGAVCRQGGCVSGLHWLRDQPRYALLRMALGRASRIVCPSRWMQGELSRNGVESDCIPLPVSGPTTGFARTPARHPTFVFVGRLSREKGVDLLLRAFGAVVRNHAGARLRVVGDGPLEAETHALAATLGLSSSVDFTGRLPRSGVEAMLADAWALVAPSTWAEPYGMVVAEAILCGVPVVATSTGGFAETVDPGVSGLLVPNGDRAGLERALDDVASGRAFPQHSIAGDATARLAERLRPDRHVQRLHSLITP